LRRDGPLARPGRESSLCATLGRSNWRSLPGRRPHPTAWPEEPTIVLSVPSWSQVFAWIEQHNGLITAVATAALAALTAVLALENRTLLKASAAATEATKRAARAAEDQATASAEALQLDWRPVLTFHHSTETHTITGAWSTTSAVTYVRNVGRGPALNTRFLHRKRDEDGNSDWQRTKRFSLAGGGDTVSDHAWVKTDPHLGEPSEDVWGGAFPNASEVLICQDQAGHLYRFVDPQPIPDSWREGEKPQPWVAGTGRGSAPTDSASRYPRCRRELRL
jgi:hypothetical protein